MQRHLPGIKELVLTGVVFSGILLVLFASQSCSPSDYSGKMEALTIATVPTEVNALFYIAEAQSIFARNGLKVTLKENHDSGAAATAGMLKGEADIASATEFLMVRQILNRKDIICLVTVAKYENTYIIWRANSGIKRIEDLKGKKIGVPLQTIAEFYLGRTLDLNGMNIQLVTLVDIRAAESERAFVNGEVDAIVTWEPWVTQISQRMGKEVITKALQSSQHAYWNLVGTVDWAKNHPGTVKRLVKSLTEAEDYLTRHNAEAKAIVRKRMNLDDAYVEIVWPRCQFSLSLGQPLILAMEDEARWMIKNGLTTERTVPDFAQYIYLDGLKAIRPEAVNIVR